MKIVCISGKARHGKDTVAGIMKTKLESQGKRVLIAHYGDLVKYICEKYFDWDGQKDEKGRTLLQYVGTDVVRAQEPDFWVAFIQKVLTLFPNEWDYVLIPDCRFPNEIEFFRNGTINTYLVRVNRPNHNSGLTPQQLNHPSETALDSYTADYYIINDSTLNALESKISEIIQAIGGNNA